LVINIRKWKPINLRKWKQIFFGNERFFYSEMNSHFSENEMHRLDLFLSRSPRNWRRLAYSQGVLYMRFEKKKWVACFFLTSQHHIRPPVSINTILQKNMLSKLLYYKNITGIESPNSHRLTSSTYIVCTVTGITYR
jgi:hypothetical protein